MSNSDQNKIDWDYWLNLNGIKDYELILLTMNIDPHDEESDFFDGTLSLPRVDANEDLSRVFLNRRRFLNDWRYMPFWYLPAVDGLAFNTFNHGSYSGEINLKRFLVWYTKEGKNWADMPKEMLGMAEHEAQKISPNEAPKEAQKPNNGKEHPSTKRKNENDLKLIGALLEILRQNPRRGLSQSSLKQEILDKYDFIGIGDTTIDRRFKLANDAFEEAKKTTK